MALVKSRKLLRKEQRKAKKAKRNEFNLKKAKNKPMNTVSTQDNKNTTQKSKGNDKNLKNKKSKQPIPQVKKSGKKQAEELIATEQIDKSIQMEKTKLKKLKREMKDQRRKQLLKANEIEDRNIRKLEKGLHINKRKSKSIPKSFIDDGLDFLLEVCDPETMKNVAESERHLTTAEDEFEEDFALVTGTKSKKKEKNKNNHVQIDSDGVDSEMEGDELQDEESEMEWSNSDNDEEDSLNEEDDEILDEDEESALGESEEDESENSIDSDAEKSIKNKRKQNKESPKNKKKCKTNVEDSEESNNEELSPDDFNEESDDEENEKSNDVWEDIYGRLRTKDGEVVSNSTGKYVPPAVRARMEANLTTDKKRLEQLNRLKRTLKGLFNRLAESNMHGISRQIEDLYMNNSRNDMNDTITNLIIEALVAPVLTPERLLLEHIMLISILHANVGTEVGAHFLQVIVKKFNDGFNSFQEVEDKSLDNVVNILAQLYNFQVFHSQLLYQILKKLSEKFDEKAIECILLVLKNVGFSLRKDDPVALKQLILELQKQSTNASNEAKDNARVKYMMDILLAIKNNNVRKIPNYDTSYSEHLKKVMKGFIRKGCYVTQLNISLEDLLKAEERGKWWVVGSAWNGVIESTKPEQKSKKSKQFSEKILEIAKQQRMNTDTRRNIFCNLVTAEDYTDAFGRLLKLGLKGQEEQEIMNVLLHTCLNEKDYNPFYSLVAQKFCEYDRKYQMILKCAIWDKLRSLKENKSNQLSNLAKLLTHLFLKKGLPISTLKIIEFAELDKVTLRFMRQVLLGVLLCEDFEECQGVFQAVSLSEKLKMFKDSVRLFIQHFLLKNLNTGSVPENQKALLTERAAIIDKLLVTHKKSKF